MPEQVTEKVYQKIEQWSYSDVSGFVDYFCKYWDEEVGSIKEMGDRFFFHTGGSLSNEELIETAKINTIIWQILWESSNRQGVHVLDKGRIVPDAQD